MEFLKELLRLNEAKVKHKINESVVDNILEPLTAAYEKIRKSGAYSTDMKETVKTIYDSLRSYLMDDNLEGFHRSYDSWLGKRPDASGELFDEMFSEAGLGQNATIEDFLEKVQESLTEAYDHYDWSILPATMALYGRRTVDIVTAASEWKNHDETILVCEKPEEKGRVTFIASSGDGFEHYKKDIGKSFHAIHDQSGKTKGMYKIVNVVVLKNGEIKKKANEIGIDKKASLAVFK